MNSIELLQDLQDTYAEKLQLTVIMTDSSGKAITLPSRPTLITEYVLSATKRNYQEKIAQSVWLKKLQHPVIIDSQNISPYMGMKIIVSPIQIEDQQPYYIWAGHLIEKGYSPIVLQSLQQNKSMNIEKITL